MNGLWPAFMRASVDRARAVFVRARWRRRGAWLWPAFVVSIAVDAVVGRLLPPAGETESLVAAALLALVLNVLGVLLLSRPISLLVRRVRPDVPGEVARNYGGTIAVGSIALLLLAAGILHRPTVLAHERTMQDAIARAEAWIGDRAPQEFRRNVQLVSALPIEQGTIYRACVPSANRRRSFCVIVDMSLPFPRSVKFSGYEPNSVLAAGAG